MPRTGLFGNEVLLWFMLFVRVLSNEGQNTEVKNIIHEPSYVPGFREVTREVHGVIMNESLGVLKYRNLMIVFHEGKMPRLSLCDA